MSGVNMGGVPAGTFVAQARANWRSTSATNPGSRNSRLAWVMRRERVRRLKANCHGGNPVYRSVCSNQPPLTLAARWAEFTEGRRSAS